MEREKPVKAAECPENTSISCDRGGDKYYFEKNKGGGDIT